ncbi:MAG: class I SAM-dependent methyltransferase [Vicinamibacterales bacterium]
MADMTHTPSHDSGAWTYSDTVARGLYEQSRGGLWGKYDNVRIRWEDRLTRLTLGPLVAACDRRALAEGRQVRVLDLGCGAGQAYGLLTQIDEQGLHVDDPMRFVLPADRIGRYLGLDISSAMVDQGRRNYADVDAVRFAQADLRDGLAAVADEPPFDIYVSSYGSLSHLDAPDLAACLADVVRHSASDAIVVLDVMGRYSPEWPGYWDARTDSDKVHQYSMSYLYEDRGHRDIERFPLRFWTGSEIRDLCTRLTGITGTPVEPAALLDRSIFVGRHVDTREYGCRLPPLRGLVNRLYEQNARTPIEDLHVGHRLTPPDEAAAAFLQTLTACWNRVIEFTVGKLAGRHLHPADLAGWDAFPAALQQALLTMNRVVDSALVIDVDDTRANVVEPQLAYVLQRLEHVMQEGLGCGHGLLAVLRIGPKR